MSFAFTESEELFRRQVQEFAQKELAPGAKDRAIKFELKHGRFDYLHFFPHGAKAHLFRDKAEDMMFSDWWEQWISKKTLRENTEKN